MKRLLIVDDELGSRESLKAVFAREYEVFLAEDASGALKRLGESRVDLVLLDVMLPEKDGVTLLREVQAIYPDIPVIMVSGAQAVRPVVEAMKAGAYDFITKPFDVQDLRRLVVRALESSTLKRRVEVLEDDVAREFPVHGIIGQSPSFQRAMESVRKAAESDATVLIGGESGTGKELVARQLHALSPRRDEPFVAVHCAALPETLMESELFGHEKGAFTSADTRKPGRFDLAGSGTLFFDEVSEMTLSTQVKLLRVIQEREYMRVGGTQVIRTNARIVAATAKNLGEEVRARRFRDDLYYRLNVVPVQLPPLRERVEDIPLLAHYFLLFFRRSMNTTARDFAPETMERMLRYSWPGNVREMRNLVERMLVLSGHEALIQPNALPDELFGPESGSTPRRPGGAQSLAAAVDTFERDLVMNALKQAGGVQTRAAEILGTTRRILKYRMDKLNLNGFHTSET
jgi:DNA-binding NtrC family response regulator